MALLGKADPTLVKGAYAVAASNVPGDMSQIYKQREKNIKDLTEGIQAAWDSQFEAYNALEMRITEGSDLAIANTLEGKTNDSMLAAVDAETRLIKAEMQKFNKRDKGSLEWKKLEARIGKLVTTTKNNDVTWSSLLDMSKNGDLLTMGIEPGDLKLYEALINDYNNNTNETQGQIIDGDFVYRLFDENGKVTRSMTMSELKRNLTIKDATAPNGVMKTINGVMKTASTTDRKWDDVYKADTKNKIKNHLKSANDRTNVIHENFDGMEFTFFEALTGKDPAMQAEIYDALDAISSVGLDVNKDGIKDNEMVGGVPNFDYTTRDNAIALQKAIINSAGSKDLIANFLTNNIGANAYGLGNTIAKKSNTGHRRISNPKSGVITFTPNQKVINDIVSTATMNIEDMNNKLKFQTGGEVVLSDDGTMYEFWKGAKKLTNPAPVSINDREGVRAALYNLTGTSTGQRITPDIVTGVPTIEDIDKAEAIQLQQKQYKEGEIKKLIAPNKAGTTKKIKQIFNTSSGGMMPFSDNNPENVTKAFQNSSYADAGIRFEFNKDKDRMKATWNGQALLFNTEHKNFQSAFRKWFLKVVDPMDVAGFNQL